MNRVHAHENLIFSAGTQVVALREMTGTGGKVLHPKGAVGVVVRSPSIPQGSKVRRWAAEEAQ